MSCEVAGCDGQGFVWVLPDEALEAGPYRLVCVHHWREARSGETLRFAGAPYQVPFTERQRAMAGAWPMND
jgi:hypothetical protein